jgi:hypothetical protein
VSFIDLYGPGVLIGAAGGAVYWILQKLFEKRISEQLEDKRHAHALALQSEKIRFDLYNRRFEIFSSIFGLYETMAFWEGNGTAEQISARSRFFRAYQESGFLFHKESGIEDLLKTLNDAANKVIGIKQHPELFKADPAHGSDLLLEETNTIQTTVFTDGLEKLKLAMARYLNFHNVEG